ncbi:MAG: endonuclease V [Elusimicrobiales bacterium]|nr:endonuclease V [Elusimicrobiales bacterium]
MDTQKLIEIQKSIYKKIKIKPYNKEFRKILAFDISFDNDDGYCVGVMLDRDFKIIEEKYTFQKVKFPYISGFLMFREMPLILKTYKKFNNKPDIILIDGHGTLHPRRCGIAVAFGVKVKKPTIGVAKSFLYGIYEEPDNKKNSFSYVYDKNGDKIGTVLRTRENTKPVFVSPGNLIDILSSIKIVKKLIGKYRIIEPLRIAHIESNRFRKGCI